MKSTSTCIHSRNYEILIDSHLGLSDPKIDHLMVAMMFVNSGQCVPVCMLFFCVQLKIFGRARMIKTKNKKKVCDLMLLLGRMGRARWTFLFLFLKITQDSDRLALITFFPRVYSAKGTCLDVSGQVKFSFASRGQPLFSSLEVNDNPTQCLG